MTKTKSFFSRIKSKLGIKEGNQRFEFYDIGFHGDKYLLQVVDFIIPKCTYFIETGTNVGSTLAYVARKYPEIKCLSCEPDSQAFEHALINTSTYTNATIFNETSQEFIARLCNQYSDLFTKEVLFWLDAHGYGFDWPLKDELNFITAQFDQTYILIDDFKVPGQTHFGYDQYQNQICSYDYIKPVLNSNREYRLYYPTYANNSSKHHQLRGWGLLEFGHKTSLNLSKILNGSIRRTL